MQCNELKGHGVLPENTSPFGNQSIHAAGGGSKSMECVKVVIHFSLLYHIIIVGKYACKTTYQ